MTQLVAKQQNMQMDLKGKSNFFFNHNKENWLAFLRSAGSRKWPDLKMIYFIFSSLKYTKSEKAFSSNSNFAPLPFLGGCRGWGGWISALLLRQHSTARLHKILEDITTVCYTENYVPACVSVPCMCKKNTDAAPSSKRRYCNWFCSRVSQVTVPMETEGAIP